MQCQPGKVAEVDLKMRRIIAQTQRLVYMDVFEKNDFSHLKTSGILSMSKAPKHHSYILCHTVNK